MAVVKRLVCLANSRKFSGRCVAGKEVVDCTPGAWVRPVSARVSEEVNEYERRYECGSEPGIGDVIDVPLLEPRPRGHQRENWLLDATCCWVRRGRLAWDGLTQFVDPPGPLWINGESTGSGVNDRIPEAQTRTLRSSLRLVRVSEVQVVVRSSHDPNGAPRLRVQARFTHHGEEYAFWVTDPLYEDRFRERGVGSYRLGESLLTVSVGEPYAGACYKLVATIIECPSSRLP